MSSGTPAINPSGGIERQQPARRTDVLRASPPMFDSPWLDRLSRVHPAVPPAIFAPAIGILLAAGFARTGALVVLAWFAGGYAFWTLTEYWLHRIVFHFEPESGIGARLHWIIHGVHHDHPNDPKRLVMPPSVSVPLAAVFVLAFWVVIGGGAALATGPGFLAGYLIYDMTHYALHPTNPRGLGRRRLRELPMRH